MSDGDEEAGPQEPADLSERPAEGATLSSWLREGDRSWREILDVLRSVGTDLTAAHAAGLVHRNINPDHIVLDKDGRVRLVGFAQEPPPEPPKKAASSSTADDPSPVDPAFAPLEDAGPEPHTGLGPPLYWAPEQHLDQPIDARADQYSYCVVLHEALYRQPPFDGKTAPQLLRQKLVEQIREPLWSTRIPARIQGALRRGLRAKPEERYPSMDALLDVLQPELRFPRRNALLLAGAGLAAGSAGLFAFGRKKRNKAAGPLTPAKALTTIGLASEPVFSPDGARIAYISNGRNLHVLDLNAPSASGPGPRVLSEKPLARPRWLPNGADIALTSTENPDERHVFSIAERHLSRAGELVRDTFSTDGSRAAGLNPRTRELAIEDRRTGKVDTLHLKGHYRPLEEGAFSPAGDWLLLLTAGPDLSSIWLVGSTGAPERELFDCDEPLRWAAWSPRGDAIYALTAEKTLLKIPVDPRAGALARAPRELFTLPDDILSLSLSRDGKRLVYAGGPRGRDLAVVTNVNPWGAGNASVTRFTADGAQKLGLCISPDGLSVAYRRADRPLSICTFPFRHPLNPEWITCFGGRPVGSQIAWSPDGRSLAFASPHEGTIKVFRIGVDASGLRLVGGSDVGKALAWGPGRNIAYYSEKERALMLLDPETGEERLLAKNADPVTHIHASPNGRLLAFADQSPMRFGGGLMVVGVDDGQVRLLASNHRPIGWTTDSQQIYSVSPATDRLGSGVKKISLASAAGRTVNPAAILPFEQGALDIVSLPIPNMAFVCEIQATVADLWVIDDFDA